MVWGAKGKADFELEAFDIRVLFYIGRVRVLYVDRLVTSYLRV
jgi:hypothetical protein